MIYLVSATTIDSDNLYDIYYLQEKNIYVCFPKAWLRTNIIYDISKEKFYTKSYTFDRGSKTFKRDISPTTLYQIHSMMLDNLLLDKIFTENDL